MTNKPKSFFETWEEREAVNSKDITSISNLIEYLHEPSKHEDSDIKKVIEELNNPASLSFIYSFMFMSPESWGNLDVSSIQKLNEDFYGKLIAIHKVVVFDKQFIDEKINKASKEKFNPFQTETEDSINAINSGLDALNTSIKSIEEKTEHTDEKIENKIKSNVYSEFITILGIFTAITFAIFGGMNLLTDLFKNMGRTSASLGQTLILAAIFGLIMWGITLLLFYWISTIKKDQTRTFYKNWGFWLNVLFIVLIAGILFIGIILFTGQQISVQW